VSLEPEPDEVATLVRAFFDEGKIDE